MEIFKILKDDAVKVLHSVCQQIWKTQQRLQDWKRSVFISRPKKGSAKECSNYCTIAVIPHGSKVMSLLLNMLSRLVITFLPRSERLLISWVQSPSAVILELKKIKSATVSGVSPSICHEVMGPDAMILVF